MLAPLPNADVLCAYLEPIATSARAIVLGDSAVGARLLELGARSVHVFDPDAVRAAHAPPIRGVSVMPLPERDFDARDGAFDLALIPDLSVLPDAPATLARLRRVLGHDGVLLVCASNPEVTRRGVGYYELYDAVALQFANVRMIGVVRFAGTTLAELGSEDEEPDVNVDTQLVSEPDPPFAFCALASQRDDVALAPYAIIQEPEREEEEVSSLEERMTLPPRPIAPPSDGRLEAAQDRVAALEVELAAQRDALETAQSETAARAADLEAVLADTSERLDDALRVITEREKRTIDLEAALAAAKEAEERERSAHAHASARVIEMEQRAADATARAAEAERRAIELGEEIAALETRLEERGRVVAELEREVRRREALARELIARVDQDPLTKGQLDALALELARRHSELEASRWRVAELEQRLAARDPSSDQVHALRKALVQEHEARLRAQSGEELTEARAKLQEQATLLEQARTVEGERAR